jgi:hypothetical protein
MGIAGHFSQAIRGTTTTTTVCLPVEEMKVATTGVTIIVKGIVIIRSRLAARMPEATMVVLTASVVVMVMQVVAPTKVYNVAVTVMVEEEDILGGSVLSLLLALEVDGEVFITGINDSNPFSRPTFRIRRWL